jgi:transcriptional regulator with XRE-family HTH domain
MAKQKQRKSFTDELRSAVEASGLTRYAISRTTGIDQGSLCKFMQGERGLGLDSVDQLADLLGLHVASESAQRKKKE